MHHQHLLLCETIEIKPHPLSRHPLHDHEAANHVRSIRLDVILESQVFDRSLVRHLHLVQIRVFIVIWDRGLLVLLLENTEPPNVFLLLLGQSFFG